MAHSKNKKKKVKVDNGNRDILGVTLIVISAFLLLCIVIKPILGIFSEAIFGVLLGVFGLASYPMLVATLLLGIFIMIGKKVEAETKMVVGIALAIVFGLVIFQLASTHSFLNKSFSDYIESTYAAKYSAGGIIMGLLAFGLKALITEIATYIIMSLALILDIMLMTSAFSKIRVFTKNRKDKAPQEEAPAPAAPAAPAQPQMVIDATPPPGLFTGMIERGTAEISVETGSASDIPTDNTRRVSDYREKTVFNEPEHTTKSELARKQIYSDRDEILRQSVEGFRESKPAPEQPVQPVQPVAPVQPAQPAQPAPAPIPEYMEPAERVLSDVQSMDMPRRVDYDGTPGNLDALCFPVHRNITFNDVGIENFVDEHPVRETPPEPMREPILSGSDFHRPSFGMPSTNRNVEYVEPITDGFRGTGMPPVQPVQPVAPVQPPVQNIQPVQPPVQPVQSVQPVAPEPISMSADDEILRELGGMTEVPAHVPPLETERFKPDDIFNANDEINNNASGNDDPVPEQEEILMGNEPLDIESLDSGIEDISADNQDDGILNATGLVISDEPAVDLSERGFDGGDVFTGEDLSGMYVAADEPEKPVKQPKQRKSSAPIENQMTIEGVLQKQAEETVVLSDSKQYKHYNYKTPPYDLLKIYESEDASQEELDANARRLEEVVSRFLKTQVNVINIVPGPQVTRYEMDVPSGTSVKSIEAHTADIAYELAAISGVRVQAPIPGKRAVGIEVPNTKKSIVGLREVVMSPAFIKHKSKMVFSVGKDIGGELVVCDLEKIPHLLIAGQTGSGKSAGLNSLIVSLLYKASPEDMRLILIDPKRVEFSKFRGMPHMLFEKTVTEPTEALNALKWADNEMNRRYTVMQKYMCSQLSEYNNLPDVVSGKLSKLPHIVIIIDELANLMQSSVAGEIETRISSIAALARACGIHLIVATQRPSNDVITGTIKANLTSRIAFKVPDAINSRIIMDVMGAEALTGNGDMLFYPQDAYAPRRVQGSFVSGEEVLSVVNYMREHYECDFDEDAEKYVSGGGGAGGAGGVGGNSELDALSPQVMALAIKAKQISTTVVQRRFSIGYARAARIIDGLEQLGYIGPLISSSKPRDVLMTEEEYKDIFGRNIDDN
ncbi:MAG: DUF87 domain-containing protein [Clostridiales bacterium]|nr:DUF87 domain-containing protein [Clostridiales bacterium]